MEDEEMFRVTEQGDNRTPMPFLVNPQTDMPPLFSCQTVKRAIDFTLGTNTWQDDAGSPMRQCLTGGVHHHREFLFADGRCTHAESATAEDTPSAQ